jgi:predicted tellurium resistance membrane protein TerC
VIELSIELLSDPAIWLAFLTLSLLEIVLGIDNIIFISILVGRLPPEQRQKARLLGLGLAMFMRIALLLSIAWVMTLQRPLFELFDRGFSGRDLILIGGGLFLIAKSVFEIHDSLEGEAQEVGFAAAATSFAGVIAQIAIIDIVFSLDSVITAVGMTDQVPVMVAAIVAAVLVMMLMAKPISEFVDRHPTVKMLALSFLVLIGTALVADGLGFHIPKGYIYFAMAFSILVEILNLRVRRARAAPVRLRKSLEE